MARPEFLLIPMVVYDDRSLSPTDKIIYAVVYWFEHMRYGKCIASNSAIADIAKVDDRTVRVGLEHLEAAGFLKRHFKDQQRKIRSKITCIVRFDKLAKEEPESEDQVVLPGLPDDRPETPKQFASRFFGGDENALKMTVEGVLRASHNRVPKEALQRELRKFISYWTEPNGTGTKQLWQMKPTFEVNRRLYNWLSKTSVSGSMKGQRAGAGVVL